jgi:uncharacterized protein
MSGVETLPRASYLCPVMGIACELRVTRNYTHKIEKEEQEMHPSEQLARTCIIATASGDVQSLAPRIANHIVFHFPGRSKFAGDYFGKPVVLEFWANQSAFMDDSVSQVTIQDVHIEGEQVLALVSLQGKVRGKLLQWHGYDMLHVRSAQIVEWWRSFDDQGAFDDFWSYTPE